MTDYLSLQGRFKHLKDDEKAFIQKNVDFEWARLMHRMKLGETAGDKLVK